MALTRPKIYIRNPNLIMCQIIRTTQEMKEFSAKDAPRRCLINDWLNYQQYRDGIAPYNQNNISFGIKLNLYEACSGQTIKKF
jgi:hypothetical protein